MLFCDDSTRFASVNQLTERHSELAAKRQHLQGQLDSATRVSQSIQLRSLSACRKAALRLLGASLRLVRAIDLIHRLLNVTLHPVHRTFLIRPQSSAIQPLPYSIQVR